MARVRSDASTEMTRMKNKSRPTSRHLMTAVVAAVLLSGCASTPGHPEDPLEGYNRAMFAFNERVDKAVLKPAAEVYDTVMPDLVRRGVGNFFGNLGDPWIGANNLLQGKVADGLSDLMRFGFNSTFGILGLLDVASEMGFPKHDEDFGQTLGWWGVGEGPYFVLPLFGPRTVRDAVAFPVDMVGEDPLGVDHVRTRNSLTALRVVHVRSTLLGTEKTLEEGTLDKYSYVRDFYLEQRRYKVFDGSPPRVYEDFDEASAAPLGEGLDAVANAALQNLELAAIGDPALIVVHEENN